ncbi:MAG: hypothetical protein N3A38_03115 [Planctomycetota bacterium]|nr:hypothetical protein [Planctomycetota bacterium]
MKRLIPWMLAAGFIAGSAEAQNELPKFSRSYSPGNYSGLSWSSKTPDAALKDGRPVVLFVYFPELADKRPNNIAYNIEIRCLADEKLKEILGKVTLVKLSAKSAAQLPRSFGQTSTASLYVIDQTGQPIYKWVDTAPTAQELLPALQQAVALVDQQVKKKVVASEPILKLPPPPVKDEKKDPAPKQDAKDQQKDQKKDQPADEVPKKKKVVDED